MICPNCDGILNAVGCQACGWQHGTPWPLYRMVQNSHFPLKTDGAYPGREVQAPAEPAVEAAPEPVVEPAAPAAPADWMNTPTSKVQ